MTTPLSGVRVVELATGIAGPYAGKLLTDAGAEVLKVEPPEGDPLRRWSASGTSLAPGTDGPLFRFLNASKRSRAIDWTTAAGREALLALAAEADLVIESVGPEAGLDATVLAARAPSTSLVSVSWFGRSGPWSDRPATEFTLQAWAGSTGLRGTVDRPPLAAGGRLGEWLGGAYAALGGVTALLAARANGRGQHADVSLLEVVHLAMAPFVTIGESFTPGGRKVPRMLEIPSVEPARDGYVGFCTITNQQWRDFLVLIGRDDLVDDAELAYWLSRDQRRHEVYGWIHAWTRQHTIEEIIERASVLRIPVAPIGDGRTIPAMDHFRVRGVFVPAPGASWMQPRVPYRLGRGSVRPFRPSPGLGQGGDRAWVEPHVEATPPGAGAHPAMPFAGLRIIDFTIFWAGPTVTHWLAAFGADVIKVESIQRPDGIRFATTQPPTADRWWEWSPLYNGINPGKRGITLDLGQPRGAALARGLIAKADVVVENFSPRVLDNLGLRYDDLARENPRLVMIRMPAFGLDGPWRDRVGFAQTMEQISGMAWLTGFADGPPVIPRGLCDPLAGVHATFALLLALEHRRRTGEGQLVEVPMVEAALNATAEQTLEWQAHATLLARDGNRGPVGAPQNLYACLGNEQWVALAVETDGQWAALARVLGHPTWAMDPALAHAPGRRVRHAAIDAELGRWCAARERDTLVETLLAAGIPAAPVVLSAEISRNPQLRARGFFEPVAHPVNGMHEIPAPPVRFAGRSRWYTRPAPTLGQHTEEVLGSVLGCSAAELADLRAAGIIGTRPVGV